jgi:anti-anti-sigma factor
VHLLAIAADAVGDLAYRNPRLARRWQKCLDTPSTNLLDVVDIRFGGHDRRAGSHHVNIATEVADKAGLWLTIDLAAEPVKLTAGGQLDASTVSVFQDGVECCAEAAQGPVEVDLASLRFMGLVGLRSLLEAADRLTSAGSFVLVDPPPVIGHLLGSTGRLDVVPARRPREVSTLEPALHRGDAGDTPDAVLSHAAGT